LPIALDHTAPALLAFDRGGCSMADKSNSDRDLDEQALGTEEIRGVASEEDEFEDIEDLDEEEEEEEGPSL
jgi:hypothetical protein